MRRRRWRPCMTRPPRAPRTPTGAPHRLAVRICIEHTNTHNTQGVLGVVRSRSTGGCSHGVRSGRVRRMHTAHTFGSRNLQGHAGSSLHYHTMIPQRPDLPREELSLLNMPQGAAAQGARGARAARGARGGGGARCRGASAPGRGRGRRGGRRAPGAGAARGQGPPLHLVHISAVKCFLRCSTYGARLHVLLLFNMLLT